MCESRVQDSVVEIYGNQVATSVQRDRHRLSPDASAPYERTSMETSPGDHPEDQPRQRLRRLRRPRVRITYPLERDGLRYDKELPFVVGVLSELSGMPEEPLPSLGRRKF